MANLFALGVSLFPYNPAIDGPLEHRHLILIYGLTWTVHLVYVAYIGLKWRSLRKERASDSDNGL
jgi:hypothetical protein